MEGDDLCRSKNTQPLMLPWSFGFGLGGMVVLWPSDITCSCIGVASYGDGFVLGVSLARVKWLSCVVSVTS